jgi:glycosidase
MKYIISLVIALFIMSCSQDSSVNDPYAVPENVPDHILESVPQWAKEAVWYQIFVERFRSGDAGNQPELWGIEGSWPHNKPQSWSPTPWGQDWYRMEDWAQESGLPFYETVHMRRYGGDLQGVIDKLDYLADLGITAIYFNPLKDSPSLHKYDVRNYHHVDIFFGPDPEGDARLIATENPANPETWVWTSADKLFLKLIQEARKRDIRVIMDYSWNHTGITFWAWQDVLKNQDRSAFADWYRIDSFNNEQEGTQFSFRGWAGVAELPEFRRHGEGANLPIVHSELAPADLHPELKRHIFAVTRRWMDPEGNGDTTLGVDGFRLDVAELIPAAFWRDYRKFVRSINPEAYLVGELWWDEWPDKLLNPNPWLQGDIFDANMNYRWYMPTRSYFGATKPDVPTPSAYIAHIDSVFSGVSRDVVYAQMNLTSSHDSPRFMTSMLNKGQYKFRTNPREYRRYNLRRADEETLRQMNMVLLKKFSDAGAPHIWMGDEMGMWGADDPDTRKPLIWPDIEFEPESADPFNRRRGTDEVAFDSSRFHVYRDLIAMRRENPVLIHGGKTYTLADDERLLLGYERYDGERMAVVLFNSDDNGHTIIYDVNSVDARVLALQSNPAHDLALRNQTIKQVDVASFELLYSINGATYQPDGRRVRIELPPLSGIVLIKK